MTVGLRYLPDACRQEGVAGELQSHGDGDGPEFHRLVLPAISTASHLDARAGDEAVGGGIPREAGASLPGTATTPTSERGSADLDQVDGNCIS